MCARCWALVPADLQRAVYDTVGLRKNVAKLAPDESWAPWWRAQAKAIDAALREGVKRGLWAEREPGVTFDKTLAGDMAFADYLEGKIDAATYTARRGWSA